MFASIYADQAVNESVFADFAYRFSPLIEITKPNTAVIGVEGCELLFGSAYGLVQTLHKQAKIATTDGGVGLNVNVALAANPDVAIHAATNLPGVTFISPGEELTCLGDFSIDLLDYSLIGLEKKDADEIFETLRLWGVKTFREFVMLPVAGVSERLGQSGLQLQQLAAGKTERYLKLKQPPRIFTSSIELEYPLTELEPLAFVFARLLNQLCAGLNAYGLATNELLVDMQLNDQEKLRRKLTLPYPLRDPKVLLKLLLLDIEMHPPQAAITLLSITCDPVKPRVLQSGLFIPLAPAPDKLELTLARLSKLVGEDNVGSPSLLDTHRPDAFQLKRFVLTVNSDKRRRRLPVLEQQKVRKEKGSLGFRMLRPPLPAVVQTQRGCPQHISAWSKQRSVYGKVVRAAGPWRTSGDWWRHDGWSRDEWDVALQPSGVNNKVIPHQIYRIYRELSTGSWFVEGSYD